MAPSRKRKRTASSVQAESPREAPPAPAHTAHVVQDSNTPLVPSTDQDSVTSATEEGKPAGRCRLLELPGELRNAIYEYVLVDAPVAHLPRQSRTRQLITNAPLATANKQIRSEFLDMATTAGPLTTTVRNYNFSHLITFFNRLDEAELKRLEAGGEDGKTTAEREVTIKLVFLGPVTGMHEAQLVRWLNRCENPTKNGSKINFKYTCDQVGNDGKYDSEGNWYLKNPHYTTWVEEARIKVLGGDEAEKMSSAIGEARLRKS